MGVGGELNEPALAWFCLERAAAEACSPIAWASSPLTVGVLVNSKPGGATGETSPGGSQPTTVTIAEAATSQALIRNLMSEQPPAPVSARRGSRISPSGRRSFSKRLAQALIMANAPPPRP